MGLDPKAEAMRKKIEALLKSDESKKADKSKLQGVVKEATALKNDKESD
jgi:hypothetical protein